ncbi:MAG: hypothetical protein IJE25_05490 [Clostridia bacterium]|nr:hypothetical protein [Clostridia bacterium]
MMKERKYDDIIDLPCPTSERHPRMARGDRAAQFAPFAALSGYEDAISEAERLTLRDRELGEDTIERLDRWQKVLSAIVDVQPRLRLSYFVPDEKKKRGGSYVTLEARLCGFSAAERCITLEGGVKVKIENIKSIESELFSGLFDEGFDF